MSWRATLDFRSACDLHFAAGPDDGERVVIAIKGDPFAHLIGGDHVELLALELAARILFDIVGLRREAHDERPLGHVRDRLDDVGRGLEIQFHRDALLFDFLFGDGDRLKISHRRRRNEYIGIRHLAVHRGVHVARALHIDARDAGGVCSCTGPVTMVTCAPPRAPPLRPQSPFLPELRFVK